MTFEFQKLGSRVFISDTESFMDVLMLSMTGHMLVKSILMLKERCLLSSLRDFWTLMQMSYIWTKRALTSSCASPKFGNTRKTLLLFKHLRQGLIAKPFLRLAVEAQILFLWKLTRLIRIGKKFPPNFIKGS